MVAAISIAATAYGALSSADNLLGRSPLTSAQEGSTRHWSFYVMCTSAAIGVVTAVASAILGQFIVTGSAAFLTLTAALAAYQIRNLGLLKTLEGYVEKLAERVSSLGSVVSDLRSERQKLEASTRELRQSSAAYKETVQRENAELRATLAKAGEVEKAYEAAQAKWDLTQAENRATITALEEGQTKRDETIKELKRERRALATEVDRLKAIKGQLGVDLEGVTSVQAGLDSGTAALRHGNTDAAALVTKLGTHTDAEHDMAHRVESSSGKIAGTTASLHVAVESLGGVVDRTELAVEHLEKFLKSPELGAIVRTSRKAKGLPSPDSTASSAPAGSAFNSPVVETAH